MELSEFEKETLSDDGEFVLSRLRDKHGSSSTWLTVSLAGNSSAESQARLEHFYSLREVLDGPDVTRPHSLSTDGGVLTLVLEDPGGVSLASVPAGSLSLARCLGIAANIAAALQEIHSRGLMHKDVRPAKILVDLRDDSVALTGFGRASKATRERQPSGPGPLAVPSLAYLAPEQTGLLNRGVDLRCDLYSLGVVLYALLSGRLPYRASTPTEWLHCHIAREPVALADVSPDVPFQIANIVSRLLSKAAEDRYQTAFGVEYDLRRCLDDLSTTGEIQLFELGTRDAPDRLLIPERLYGREREIAALSAVFDRVAAEDGAPELVLVSGFSGIGKSALVSELQKTLVKGNGRFAFGKFDQYKRDIPYATLAQAFQQLVRQLIDEESDSLPVWERRLKSALGANGQLIVDLIPEVERIIGPQPAVPELPPSEAQSRFLAVLTRFIEAFARAECPLVIFLDDLQWLDGGTSQWLEGMAFAEGTGHLMIVGAYRDNEVSPGHLLWRTLDAQRESARPVNRILLSPLKCGDIQRLIGDALHAAYADVLPLAEFIFDKTGGNPFFVVQFLRIIDEDGLLQFSHETRTWSWDIDCIRTAHFAESIVDLMVMRISRVDERTQSLLKRFACLGNATSSATLAQVAGLPENEVHRALTDAVEAGMVYQRENGYAFIHDRVQEAAYAMIPESKRAGEHLAIARMLLEEDTDAEQNVFEVANQYNRAITLVDDQSEKSRIVDLNLRAGQRAKASSAYASALTYLSVGSTLLGEAAWQHDYERKFALESSRAECEFLTGDTPAAKERLAYAGKHAANVSDRGVIAFLQVTLFTALDQIPAAVETCLEFLRHIGINWDPHPGWEAARQEYQLLLQQVGEGPIESLVDLPLLSDPDLASTLNLLIAVLPPAFFSDENLVSLVLCRVANLSIYHGNSDASALCYAYLGMVAGPLFGDYQAALSFGRLGLALVDRRGLDRFKARVYMTFAYHVTPWTQHVRSRLPLLKQAVDVASEGGDLTYMGFSSCAVINCLLTAGEPLANLDHEAVQKLKAVQQAKFGLIVIIITSQLMLARKLRGVSKEGDPWKSDMADFDATAIDETDFEARLDTDPSLSIAACWHWIRKQQWLYFEDDIDGAMQAGEKARPLLWTSSGHLTIPEYHFFGALVRARAHDLTQSADAKCSHVGALRGHYDMLKVWASHCPSNFGCRAALVQGEIARIDGRGLEALRCYETAIRLARENDFPHDEALANDVAARFARAHEFAETAVAFARGARRAYMKWGAFARARLLEAEHPQITRETQEGDASQSIVSGRFDVETVVKASQAISGEIVLEKLIRTLMSIVLEHSGARRALLVLPRGEELWTEAEAIVSGNATEVMVNARPATEHELPMSLLYSAMRSRTSVLVDDASSPGAALTEGYTSTRHVRSVLVLPLYKQAKMVGVLYLENDLTPGVFTPARVTVLGLLASQAAISLENATLEEKEALLEEKDALLHEIHHRVKNNLQLISSLLNLQASRSDDRQVAELFAESRNRVRSMAMVHENLYRAGNFARIMMAPHIRNLCRHLAQAYDVQKMGVELRTVIDDDVQLDMNRAVSCGLIVNELVSNAFKHAFPGDCGGALTVELQLGEAGVYLLAISDDGVGLPADFSLAEADSLGLQLVHDLAHQLNGKVNVDTSRGTRFEIRFSERAS